jgi:hypothetical protein
MSNWYQVYYYRTKDPYIWKGNSYYSVIMYTITVANSYKHEHKMKAVNCDGRYSEVSIAVATFAIKNFI